MIAHRERNEGCLSRALPHEMAFTLLGRDPAAGYAIRAWVQMRVMLAKNKLYDPEIVEALDCANAMDDQRQQVRKELGKK